MLSCLKTICLIALIVVCGCRDYTNEELKQQLLQKDVVLRTMLKEMGVAATNAVFRGRLLEGRLNECGYGYLTPINPNAGERGKYVAVTCGALGGLRVEDYRILLYLANKTSGNLQPSFRVTFYDRHLRRLGEVSEHWIFSRLHPGDSEVVEKSRKFNETPWYFSVN